MTNPPFGTTMTGPKELIDSFGITKLSVTSKKSHLTEILFLERNLEWLRPGGRMFIVLPDSVLGNTTLSKERAYIETKARLVATISLPPDTFGPSGAKNKTSIIILERFDDEDNSSADVFVADMQEIGYELTGRATEKPSQLPEIVEAFLSWEAGETPRSSLVDIVPRLDLGDHSLATANRKRPPTPRRASVGDDGAWSLGDICQPEYLGSGKTAARAAYVESGAHMVKVGNLTGRGIQWGCVTRQYVDPKWAAKYPRLTLAKHDILFTSSAHGPKWIGLKVDMFTELPAEYGETSIYCGELMRVRVSPDVDVDPFYVLLFLRSPAGYREIQRCIRSQTGHIYKEHVSEIRIPKPSSPLIQDAIKQLKSSIALQRQAAEKFRASEELCLSIFPGPPKPIIA
jgi:type I restriction enzyme M protein